MRVLSEIVTPHPSLSRKGRGHCDLLLLWSKQQIHSCAFHLGFLFDEGDIGHAIFDPGNQGMSQFLVLHFTSSKYDRQADFVALFKKLPHVLDLDIQIVAADFGPHTKLLDLSASVLLARFFELFLALVAEF